MKKIYTNPKNYWKKLKTRWNVIRFSYDLNSIKIIEREKFNKAGLSYDAAKKKLDLICSDSDKQISLNTKVIQSIHSTLLCGLSNVTTINNILEIGTYSGQTTMLFSRIFPRSKITTIDLPEEDPILNTTYGRENEEKKRKIEEERKQNLSNPNITFLQKNSFFLLDLVEKKFDLSKYISLIFLSYFFS